MEKRLRVIEDRVRKLIYILFKVLEKEEIENRVNIIFEESNKKDVNL